MKHRLDFTQVILLLTIIAVIVASSIFIFDAEFYDKNNEKIIRINKNVKITDIKTNQSFVKNLPCKLPSSNYYYEFELKHISNTSEEDIIMYIRSHYNSYKIECENQVIYQYIPQDTKVVASSGSTINEIKIPKKYLGKNIRISFYSPDFNYGIRISDVTLSSQSNLMLHNPDDKVSLLLYCLVLLLFAIESFLLILYLRIKKRGKLLTFY